MAYNPWAGIASQAPVERDNTGGMDYESRGFYSPEDYYRMDKKAWEDQLDRKRKYWQDLLGENYDESALGELSDAPRRFNPYAAFQSGADQREYLYGASPQNARGFPSGNSGIGWGTGGAVSGQNGGSPGREFMGQRPQWSDAFVSAPQPPKYEGENPLLTMTGQPSSDGQQSSLPSVQWGEGGWRRQGSYDPQLSPERPYIGQQQNNPSAQEQQAGLARLIKLLQL
jgi:hypothetical protein